MRGSSSGLDILGALALSQGSMDDLMGDLSVVCVDSDADFADSILSLVNKCARGAGIQMSSSCEAEIRSACTSQFDQWEQVYGAVAVGFQSQQNRRPNRIVTLYGPDATDGATYPASTPIILTPRKGNVVQGNLVVTKDMSIYRMVTDKVDIENGWSFVANTVKFSSEVVSGMQEDTLFQCFDVDCDADASPLANYMYRNPDSTVEFTAQAYHGETDEQPFRGVTIELMDKSCRNLDRLFGDSLFELQFAGAVQALMAHHRARCRKLKFVRSGGNTGVVPPGLPAPR